MRLTDVGRAAQGRIKELVTGLRTEVHEGSSDEDYVTALKDIRRMIGNIESTAD